MRKYYCILISLWALSSLACLQAQDDFNVATTVSANGLRGEVQQVDIDNLVRKEYYRTDWEQRPWFTDKLREFLQEADGQIVKFDKKGLIQQTTVTSEGNKVGTVKYEYSKGRITGYEGFGTLVQAKYNGSRADVNIYGYGGVVNFKPRVTKHGIDTWDWKTRRPVRSIKGAYQFVYTCRQRYDNNGMLRESRYLYVDSTVAKIIRYTYTHRDLMTEMQHIEYRDNKPFDTTTVNYAYDIKGNLCKATIRSRSVDEVYVFNNNEYGDPETVQFNSPYASNTYSFKYIYDTLTNWTTRLEYKDGEFKGATLRTITYYSTDVKEDEIYVYFEDDDDAKSKAKVDKKEKKSDEAKVDKKEKKNDEAKADKKEKKNDEAKADKKSNEAKADKKEKKEAKADNSDNKGNDKAKKEKKEKAAQPIEAQQQDKPAQNKPATETKPITPATDTRQNNTEPEIRPATPSKPSIEKADNNEIQGEEIIKHIYIF